MYKIISITISFILLLGCSKEHIEIAVFEESKKYNFSNFIKTIDEFPYTAPPEKRKIIINSYQYLKIGMKKDKVKDVFGDPDAEFLEYKRKYKENSKDNLMGYTWVYYLHRIDSVYASEGDKNLVLYFNIDDVLYLSMPDNIDSLKLMGGPHLRHR